MDLQLQSKTFLVTGGIRGLGRAISEGILAEGAKVVAGFRSNHALAGQFVEDCEKNGTVDRLLTCSADLQDESEQEKLLNRARERFGPLHGLVNCAAIKVDPEELTIPNLAQMAVTNGIAPAALTCRALDFFDPSGASVVNILTVLKEVYYPEADLALSMAHHGASKAYLETASRLMMDELRQHEVRINCIAPGPTRGGGLSKSDAVHAERFEKGQYGMKRRAEPADIVNAVLFLLSPLSSHVTGQTLYVTGGQERAPFFYPPQT